MSENITGVIITDCCDENARGRQETAFKALFDGVQPTFVGVDAPPSASGLEVGGNVVDRLDVLDSFAGGLTNNVMLANAAWRGSGTKERHDNGTPFCYTWIENTLLVSTFGDCLTLARDQGIIGEVELVDAPTVLNQAVDWGDLTPQQASAIADDQFRSLKFLPRLARWALDGRDIKSETQSLDALPRLKPAIWTVDNFGNGTTTVLPDEIGFEDGEEVALANGVPAVCHTRLTDVPTGETALTIGSKGYREKRWVEWVIGGGNAAEQYGFVVGSIILPQVVD